MSKKSCPIFIWSLYKDENFWKTLLWHTVHSLGVVASLKKAEKLNSMYIKYKCTVTNIQTQFLTINIMRRECRIKSNLTWLAADLHPRPDNHKSFACVYNFINFKKKENIVIELTYVKNICMLIMSTLDVFSFFHSLGQWVMGTALFIFWLKT